MAKHVNPNSKNGQRNQKPKTGNARRGNANAAEQARKAFSKNIVQPVKSTVSEIVNHIQEDDNNKGGAGKSVGSSAISEKLPAISRSSVPFSFLQNAKPINTGGFTFNIQDYSDRGKDDKFKRISPAKPYQFSPYLQMVKDKETWERLNDKVLNSTPDRQAELKTLQNYSHNSAVRQYATENIQHTDYWFTETDYFGDSVLGNHTNYPYEGNHFPNYLSEYLMEDAEMTTQEEWDEYTRRLETYKAYMENHTHSAKYYNPEHEEADGMRDPFSTTTVVDEDAPLPPWVENTPENQERWATYLKRSARELETVNTIGEYTHKQLQDNYKAGVEAKEKGITGKIGNASSELFQEGVSNSITDVLVSQSLQRQAEGKTLADTHSLSDSTIGDLGRYVRDYWINPLRTGHYGMFFSNRLFDLMDAVDLPAKGVRAVAAAAPHIYGDKRKMFEEQEAFVYSGGKEKQKQIMDAGGRELLYASQQLAQGYNPNQVNTKEIRQKLIDEGLWEDFKLLREEWSSYNPETSALGNLKEAYTTPGKDFYTNTGNLGKDLAVDILLDPTLIIGGGARSIAKGAAKNIARASVERGLDSAIGVTRAYANALSRDEQRVVEAFIRKMDSKTVLFRNQNKIDSDVDALAERLLSSNKLSITNVDSFRATVKSSIHDHVYNTNAAIVATSKHGERNAQEAFLKTVHNIGWLADTIDSTLLKVAFPEPFLMKSMIKGSKAFADNSIVGQYFSTIYNRRRLKKLMDARRAFGDDYKGINNLTVDQIEHFKNIKSGAISMDTPTELRCVGATESKLRLMQGSCERILNRLYRGNITSDEALLQLKNELQTFAGREKCESLDDLDVILENRLSGFFTDDTNDVYSKFKRSYRSVEDLINRRVSKAKSNFIYEISRAKDADHLLDIFKKYNDQLDYTEPDLLQNIGTKCSRSISDGDLQNVLKQVSSIPKKMFVAHDGSITEKEIIRAAKQGANTDPFDFVKPLSGHGSYKIKDINTLINKTPKYSNLSLLLKDKNITCFNRLNNLLHSQAKVYKTDEIIQTIEQTFFDVSFKYSFSIPADINKGLDELYSLRDELTQKITSPQNFSSGAIYQYQLDRMVFFEQLINDSRVLKFFDRFTDQISPLIEDIRNGTCASFDSVNHLGFVDLLNSIDQKIQSINVFYRLNSELSDVIDPIQKSAILDHIFGLTDESAEDVVAELISNPSRLMKSIDDAIYSSCGENRLSIRAARVRIKSFSDNIWGRFSEEINNSPELQKKVMAMCDADPADPMSYVNLQILQNILLDPDAIKYYNDVNENYPVVFAHCSTSGLNPGNSQITGIAYKQWIKLPENASLKDIFDNILDRNNESLRVALDDTYFDNTEREFLNKIYDSHASLTHADYGSKLSAYKALFGKRIDPSTGKLIELDEGAIIEEFCKQLQDLSFSVKGKKQIKKDPCIIVHDFEGFNLPFLNSKITKYQNEYENVGLISQDLDAINRLSENSFDTLKRITNEHTLSNAERDSVASSLYHAFSDMNEIGSTFTNLSFRDVSAQLKYAQKLLSSKAMKNSNDPVIKQIQNAFYGESGLVQLLPDVYKAISDIDALSTTASEQLLYRYSTTPKVRTGLYTLNDAEHWQKNIDEFYAAVDELTQLYGISALVREPRASHFGFGHGSYPHINIQTKELAAIEGLPNYYDDPVVMFFHEFGHFLADDFGLDRFLKQTAFPNAKASSKYSTLETVEMQFIHPPGASRYDTFEDMFVQALALQLCNTEFITRLKSFYPDDTEYNKVVDLISKIASVRINIATNTFDKKIQLIEKAQDNFFKLTGLSDAVLADELAKSLYNTLNSRSALWKEALAGVITTQVNPIRYSRGDDPLQYLLNYKTKIDLTNVRSYFKIYSVSSGQENVVALGYLPFKVIKKMSRTADYVVRNKELVLDSAEKYLSKYKPHFDAIIEGMRDFSIQSTRGVPGQSLQHLTLLETPKSAVESYLLCRKIYNDYLSVLDQIDYTKPETIPTAYREMLFVDKYSSPLTSSVIRDSLAQNNVRDILDGTYDAMIWQKPPIKKGESTDAISSSSAIPALMDEAMKAKRLKEVYSRVRRKIRDITNLDDHLISKGIKSKKDYKEAMLYQHVDDLLSNENLTTKPFLDALENIHTWRREFQQYYYLRRLMTENSFDEQKILNELLWNDTGMIVVYPNKYTSEVEDAFKNTVKKMDSSYIGVNYEGGAYIVYIKKGNTILENTEEGYRYLSSHVYMRSTRNEYSSIPFPEYKDIVTDGIVFTEEAYEKLKLIYQDIDYFSDGASIGTLGNRLNTNELHDFFNKIPNTVDNAAVPLALLEHDMYKSLICDPGFISTGSDIFTDILRTFENLQRTTGDVKLAAEFVFGEHSDTKVVDIISEVSNKEALDYFSKMDDYTIVQIKSGDTHSGMFLQEIKPKTETDIQRLRDTDAVIVPTELFFELQNRMNYKDANSALAVFNKALVFYKAIQLFSPGTWIRNYIDALQKAVLEENEGGLAGASQMISRSLKATNETIKVQLMLHREGSYVSARTWESLCRRYHIRDMSWEDFQLLSGLLDRDNVVYSPVHAAVRRDNVISGKSVNFAELRDEDIKKIWKYAKIKEEYVGMSIDSFNAIRKGELVPTESLKKQYDEVCRKVLSGLADYNEPKFDKVVNKIFVPFNTSEVSARYAQMLWLRDLGYSHNQCIKRVVDSQFRTLPNAHLLNKMEMIVPFATFKYNNALFWVRMIDEHPSYYRLFEHLYGNIAHDNYEQMIEDYGSYDMRNDYMLNTGGIPIGGSGLYFKLNPSCLDFFRLFYGGPADNMKGLNPWLQFAFKYSMYELGFSNSEFLTEFDYKYDMKSFIKDTAHLMPGLNKLYDVYEHFTDKSFLYQNVPNFVSKNLVKFFPSLFAAQVDFNTRSGSDFVVFQAELAKDGLWYDCNEGKIVPISQKNELGANDPRLNWDDVLYFMLVNHGKVWDANVGHFVYPDERIEGGLNQEFDLENDPNAWDRLCEEYKKVGKVYDYNLRSFVYEAELTSGGLNDPDISFDERTRLYYERFGLRWDANQNKYVDREHYIPGGLNSIDGIHNVQDFNKLKAYRRAMYGEVYERFEQPDENGRKGEFVKKYEPTCVTLNLLVQNTIDEDKYYQYVALPRLWSKDIQDCKIEDGFIKTSDGKYVLTGNEDYNNKVFDKLSVGFSSGYMPRSNFHYKRFPKFKSYLHNDYPNKSVIWDGRRYRGIYVNASKPEDFFNYEFIGGGQRFIRVDSPHRIHMTNYGRVIPYGGPYTKFSFYSR